MELTEVIKHPIDTARIAPLGVALLASGVAGEVCVVADRIIGSTLPVEESLVALGSIYATAGIALGGLIVSTKRRRNTLISDSNSEHTSVQ